MYKSITNITNTSYKLTLPISKLEVDVVNMKMGQLLSLAKLNQLDYIIAFIEKSVPSLDVETIKNLSYFDGFYLYLNIYHQTYTKDSNFFIVCHEEHGPDDDNAKLTFKITLDDLIIQDTECDKDIILAGGKLKLQLSLPTLYDYLKDLFNGKYSNTEEVYDTYLHFIKSFTIVNDDGTENTFHIRDMSDSEKEELFDSLKNNLDINDYLKLNIFFKDILSDNVKPPSANLSIHGNCPICNKKLDCFENILSFGKPNNFFFNIYTTLQR